MALSESAPPSRPPAGSAAQDLSDAEFAELDALLAGVPEPLEPLDAFMLDGFLAAIVVQPTLIEAESWLPYVFDAGGHRWGEAEPAPDRTRACELILRRRAAINRALAEYGSFDPLIAEPQAAPGETAVADPVRAALLPWVAGFDAAASVHRGLDELADPRVATALGRLYRHLPEDVDGASGAAATAARADPGDLDAAIGELVDCVATLYELTEPLRYKVDPVRRAAPKVGRNEPCPCGSGRKYKHCHGAG